MAAKAKSKKLLSRKDVKTFDSKVHGFEPVLKEIKSRKDSEYVRALNWYNYTYDAKDGKPWLLEFLKNSEFDKATLDKFKKLPDWAVPTTACWISRMANNGTVILEDSKQFVFDRVNLAVERFYEEEKPAKVNIQARVENKNEQLFGLAEEMIDSSEIDMYTFLQSNEATPAAANYIKSKYQPMLDEVMSDDEQVKEAFGKNLKKWRAIFQGIINDCERYVDNKKVSKVKKPRAIKIKPASKIVERLNYQKDFAPMKLVSANPVDIVGATQLWTYNTKSRILGVYNTSNGDTLTVKGSTIINYDESKSTGKRLRKPEEVLGNLLKAGKVGLRTFLDDIKTTTQNMNGRINKDTIILRIMR